MVCFPKECARKVLWTLWKDLRKTTNMVLHHTKNWGPNFHAAIAVS